MRMAYGTNAFMDKTTIYLSSELRRSLRDAARMEGRPQAEVIRAALEEYLGRRELPVLRSLGMGEDSELSAADSEDWIKNEWARP